MDSFYSFSHRLVDYPYFFYLIYFLYTYAKEVIETVSRPQLCIEREATGGMKMIS